MDLRTEREGDSLVVMLAGRFDDRNAADLRASLIAEAGSRETRIVIDMAAVEHVSAAALRALLRAIETSASRGVRVVLCHLRPPIRETFAVAGLDQTIEVCGTREEALAS